MTSTKGHSESIVLAGGCFWCPEAVYQKVRGVSKVVPGYAGGREPNPTYEQVVRGDTGHVESIRVTFQTNMITLRDILDIFWTIHDPTSLNRQGYDVGTQYRSAIFYANDDQRETAEASKQAAQAVWDDPIVTAIAPLDAFYEAEDYHHDFYKKHPELAYCQVIINPKLVKLREKFADQLLKE